MLNFSPEKLLLVAIIALVVLGPTPSAAGGPHAGPVHGRDAPHVVELPGRGPRRPGEPTEAFNSAMGDFRPPNLRRSVRDAISTTFDADAILSTRLARLARRRTPRCQPRPPRSAVPATARRPPTTRPRTEESSRWLSRTSGWSPSRGAVERPTGPDDAVRASGRAAHPADHLPSWRSSSATVVAWFFYDDIVHFMTHPYRDVRPAPPRQGHHHEGNLVTTGPLEGFTTRLKISAYVGIALAVAGVCLGAVAVHHPRPAQEREALRAALRRRRGRAVRGRASPRPSWSSPRRSTWLIDVSGTGIVPLFSPVPLLHPVRRRCA